MTQIPYSLRVLALVVLAGALILYDRVRHPEKQERVWEYGLLFAMGLLGAVFGAVNDSITVGISREYFIVGKGLTPGPGLKGQALLLGAQAGFSAAIVACAIWQFVLRRVPARERCGLICRFCWLPALAAVILGGALPYLSLGRDPMGLRAAFAWALGPEQTVGMLKVWWIHTGVYAGLAAGLVAGIGITLARAYSGRSASS
ncbi:hypothetical protein ACFLQU_03590 [Verrucomicrobiota bacterium]